MQVQLKLMKKKSKKKFVYFYNNNNNYYYFYYYHFYCEYFLFILSICFSNLKKNLLKKYEEIILIHNDLKLKYETIQSNNNELEKCKEELSKNLEEQNIENSFLKTNLINLKKVINLI